MQWTASSSSSSEKVNRRLIIAVMAVVYRKYTVAGLLIGNDESLFGTRSAGLVCSAEQRWRIQTGDHRLRGTTAGCGTNRVEDAADG